MTGRPPNHSFRPALLLEAHRFLKHLLKETKPPSATAETLAWLEERNLIEEVMTDAFDLEYIITPLGRRAMLGQHAA